MFTTFCSEFVSESWYFQLDVVAFAHVAQIYFLDKEVEWALRDYMIESCPNLVGHVSRMKERCFADWDDICRSVERFTK